MDGSRFDSLVRALGAGRTRRGLLGMAAGLAAGAAAGEASAKRRRCRGDSPPGQCCRERQGVVACSCLNGGTACGSDCCLLGEECRDGRCTELPEPTTCVALGEPCKGVGAPCCEHLTCASGQGGGDVACWVRKTGPCASSAECVYGTQCVDGACGGLPTCTAQLGDECTSSDVCCTGICGIPYLVGSRNEYPAPTCCAGIGQGCRSDGDCCFSLPPTGAARVAAPVFCVDGVCRYVLD